MKTQEEYVREINEIILRDVKHNQGDWFDIDRETFMLPGNKNKPFILETRKYGCDLLVLGGTNCNENNLNRVFEHLGDENFYICEPTNLCIENQKIRKVSSLYAFKVATTYFRSQGMILVLDSLCCKLMPLYDLQYIQNLQEISSEAISRLTDTKDYSRDEAFEIIQYTTMEANEVIELIKLELQNNNMLVIATLGNGGAGLDLMQNQDEDFINSFISELDGYSFDGLVDACDDIRESEYYNEDCEVYQFSDNDGHKLQVLILTNRL